MIIDQSRGAGLPAYFRNPNAPFDVNLGPLAPVPVRTPPLARGRQWDVSGIRLLIEHDDLSPYFQFRLRVTGGQLTPITPMLRVTVMKEMFPGLFADPFRHRVHNIAGYMDFNEGQLENGGVIDVEGIPTIVSLGTGLCRWTSREYTLPEPIDVASVAWELATSRLAPADGLRYSLHMDVWDNAGAGPVSVPLAVDRDQAAGRFAESVSRAGVKRLQIRFEAHVTHESTLAERHTPILLESMGTPLLRAVNILQPIASIYDLFSLTELQAESSDFRLNEAPGPTVVRCLAHLDVPAVIVHSPYQHIENGNAYDPATRYEFIELAVNRSFARVEARLTYHEQHRDSR
jgi:hypothetical protein